MKRIVTMQDISCVGKCSLTAALPVISAMGIETAVLPTAVLSTHTMFQGFTFHDLTSEIKPIMEHWKKEGFHFDAVYTGYLGSFEQLDLAAELFDTFGEKLRIVDPCMADNGKLYAGFTTDFAKAMAKLCAKADVIVPNMTEASYLLDVPYVTSYDETYVKDMLKKLTDLGSDTAVLTGISLEKGKTGAYAYNQKTDTYTYYCNEEEPEHFHGTGDLWSSAFCGALVLGKPFEKALQIACDFVKDAIHKTLEEKDHVNYGVNFEQAIPDLITSIF
ncbi:MAG: pyridoxamine kinase [Erysipelotrichaceae bacterium]|nr:pyridoxamine kinase [Erysipelotrichaceae bacterium]